MAKPELGEKQLCPECNKKFYDLGKNPALCPYCKHSFDPATIAGIAHAVQKEETQIKPDDIEDEEAEANIDEEDIDVEEAVAKELELDGDASFGGAEIDEDGIVTDTPDINELPDTDDDTIVLDDDADILPPTPDVENESLEDILASEESDEPKEED